MSRRRRPTWSDDQGASLVFAMAFLAFLGLLLGALLSFGSASFTSTTAVRDQANAVYSADAALDAAVNSIRRSSYAGGDCASMTVNLPELVPGAGSTTVTCLGIGTVGAGGNSDLATAPFTSANRPASAILTLAPPPGQPFSEDGLVQSSSNDLYVKGRVFANSNIRVATQGNLHNTNAAVYAKGTCSRRAGQFNVFASEGYTNLYCGWNGNPPLEPADSAQDPQHALPDLLRNSSGAPLRRRVADSLPCPANSVIRLQPGLYDDVNALAALTTGESGCGRSPVVYFSPGTYYFDFRDGTNTATCPACADGEWAVSDRDVRVVAGTPPPPASEGHWKVTDSPQPALTAPGMCASPLQTTAPGSGATFVFGGTSRINVTSGQVEVCAQYQERSISPPRPPISAFGVRVSEPLVARTGQKVVSTTGASTTTPAFANPGNAAEAGNGTSDVLLQGPNRTTALPQAITGQTNLTGTTEALRDDPARPDEDWLAAPASLTNSNSDSQLTTSFPAPPGSLSGSQTFRVLVRRVGPGAAHPSARVELLSVSGTGSITVLATPVATTTVSDPRGVVLTGTATAPTADPGSLRVRVVGTGAGSNNAGRSAVEVGAVAWDMAHSRPSRTASVTTSGFNASAVPAGSVVTSARLTVRHRQALASGTLTGAVTFTLPDGTTTGPLTSGLTLTSTSSLVDSTFDVSALVRRLLREGAFPAGARAELSVTASDATVAVDAMFLDVSYEQPRYRAQTGCTVVRPYRSTGSCATILGSGSNAATYWQGNVYLPLSTIDVSLPNKGRQFFTFGVTAWRVEVTVTGSCVDAITGGPCTQPVIGLPDETGGSVGTLTVYFTVFQCPTSAVGDCSQASTARERLRAKVNFNDPSGTVVPGNRQVNVESASILR